LVTPVPAVMTVAEAAARLGVDTSRVRQLVRAGEIVGERVGGVWLLDGADVARRSGVPPVRGRPLGPPLCWGLLALLDGSVPERLDPASRRRLDDLVTTLSRAPAARWRALLRGRAEVGRWLLPAQVTAALLDDPAVVRSGTAAAAHVGADVAPGGQPGPLELYVGPRRLRALAGQQGAVRLGPRSGTAPAVVVRVPRGPWPFAAGIGDAPSAVVGADLIDASDPYVVRAGTSLLQRLVRWHLAGPLAPRRRR
jgi:excisionase family DNA binding protein